MMRSRTTSISPISRCSRSSSSRESLAPSLVFDPWLVGPDHPNHYTQGTSRIIKLEDSGKVFCPLCLEQRSNDDCIKIDYGPFHQYVENLFEALDQHGENEQLRKIVLPMLDIILSRRQIFVRRDEELHEYLRILYKIHRSEKYDSSEFISLARILSGISIHSLKPFPLRSIWEAWNVFLSAGKAELSKWRTEPRTYLSNSQTKFCLGLALVVRKYLEMINDNAVDKVSDLVFPLYTTDTQQTICRKYYLDSQTKCLNFMSTLVRACLYCLKGSRDSADQTKESLHDHELTLVSELYATLKTCIITAEHINYKIFFDRLKNYDPISNIHFLFYYNKSKRYRANVEDFLKAYVLHFIREDYGSDFEVKGLTSAQFKPETYASRAFSSSIAGSNIKTTIFYVLLNCIAKKHNSEYFSEVRVRSMLMSENETVKKLRLELKKSRILSQTYLFVLASIVGKTDQRNSRPMIYHAWEELTPNFVPESFNEVLCHDKQVFRWACNYDKFYNNADQSTLKFVLEISSERGWLATCLRCLLNNTKLKHLLCERIKNNPGNLFTCIKENLDKSRIKDIIDEFGGLFPATLYAEILNATQYNADRANYLGHIINLITVINILLIEFDQFIMIDDKYMLDLIKFVERLYRLNKKTSLEIRALTSFHDLIRCLLITNNSCVIGLIQLINRNLIGYMYEFLNDYNRNKLLAESIAGLLVAYDQLDYPLVHRLDETLYANLHSVIDWCFSKIGDLHALALKLIYMAFVTHPARLNEQEYDDKLKARLSTGFLHVLFDNQSFHTEFLKEITQILSSETMKYHPMRDFVVQKYPILRSALEISDKPDTSPVSSQRSLSFEPEFSSDFNEEKESVERILAQLDREDSMNFPASLPRCIYLSGAIEEQDLNTASTEEWQRRAYEATQSSSDPHHDRLQ